MGTDAAGAEARAAHDAYQGSELPDLSLVDPDNRRPVDYEQRRAALRDLDAAPPKLRLTATALRLRREHPQWFLAGATYEPLDAGERAVAFCRSGEVVTVAPTRSLRVEREGWGDDAVTLPAGTWTDLLGGSGTHSGSTALATLLATGPALLVRA